MIKRAIVLGIAMGALALGAAIAAGIQGAGASTCKQFFLDLKSPNLANGEHIYGNWALGYISRKNMEREASGLKPIDLTPGSIDYPAQLAFLRNWCEGHPNSLYQEAAHALWLRLVELNGAGV